MEQAATQQAQQTVTEAVERKLTKGEGIPSNVEIAAQLESLKLGHEVDRQRLSETGQELSANLDQLIEDARRIFLEKNKDETLQKAAIHASRAAQIARRHNLLTTEEGRRAMEQAREGVAGGVQFARLLVTSAEFRDELVEAMGVIQQSLRRPGGRPGGQRTGEGLVPEGETTEEEAAEGYAEEEEEEEEEEEGWFEEGQGQQREEEGTAGWTGGLMGKGYQPLSQDQIDRAAQRFVNLLKRVQAKPEYQESLRFLLERLRTAFEMGGLHAERMEKQLEESETGRAFLMETQQAKDHSINLVEAWMETSLDSFFNSLNALNTKMQTDRETRAELAGLGRFVEAQLSGKAFKRSESEVVQEAKERFGRVRERLLTNYDEPIRRFLDELFSLSDVFKDNKAGHVLQQDVSSLVHALVYDEQGQPKIKIELVKDIEVLLSALLRKVQFIPIPRIAVTTPDMDFMADDIVLNLREITPKQIHLETLTRVRDVELERAGYSYREAQEEREREREEAWEEEPIAASVQEQQARQGAEPVELSTFVRIHLREIHSDLRRITFYYNKKTGMIKEHDKGLCDLRIYGKGMSISLDVEPGIPVATPEKPVAHTLEVKRAQAKIHSMSLRLYESKHDTLYTIFKPFIKNQARKAIERAVEQYMVEYVQDLDRRATESATGQYPVTRPIQLPSSQQEREAAQAQKAGTGAGAGLGGAGGVGQGFGATSAVTSKTMPVTTIGPEEEEEEGLGAGAAGPEELGAGGHA